MYRIIYSFPYIIFFIVLLFIFIWEISIKERKPYKIKNIKVAIGLSFLFFFGLRGFVNTDCINYYPFFQNLKTFWDNTSYENIISGYNWEPGFITSVYIFKSIIPYYFVWIFTWTLIAFISLNNFFSNKIKYYSLGFILFYIFGGYGICTNLMRASIAMFLFLYSIKFLEKNKWKKYILINILGFTFHISSIIYFLVTPIIKKKWPLPFIIILFIILNIAYLLRIDFSNILLLISNYTDSRISLLINSYIANNAFASTVLSIGYIERIITYLIVIILYKRYNKTTHSTSKLIFLNSYIIYFFFYYLLWKTEALSTRIGGLFIFSYWIIYADLFSSLKGKNNKKIFILLFSMYSILKLISGQSQPFHQYKNILFNNEKFEQAEKRIHM